MCCLINSSHTQVDSPSPFSKRGLHTSAYTYACQPIWLQYNCKETFWHWDEKQISRGRVNNLPFLGIDTHLPNTLQIFKHKVLSKSSFRIQCVTNTAMTMLTTCNNSELELRGPEKQAAFKDRGQMHDAVLLHRAALLNAHHCELPPTESVALWGSLLKGISGVPLNTIQASCNSWKHSGKANSTKSKCNLI